MRKTKQTMIGTVTLKILWIIISIPNHYHYGQELIALFQLTDVYLLTLVVDEEEETRGDVSIY